MSKAWDKDFEYSIKCYGCGKLITLKGKKAQMWKQMNIKTGLCTSCYSKEKDKGSSLKESSMSKAIQKVRSYLLKNKVPSDLVSPNYVADVAYTKLGLDLTSEEVVYIVNNWDTIKKDKKESVSKAGKVLALLDD